MNLHLTQNRCGFFFLALAIATLWFGCAQTPDSPVFKVTIADSLNSEDLTGRLFVALSPDSTPEPRIAAYYSARTRVARVPFFSNDIENHGRGDIALIDENAVGYPLESIRDIPPGEYYVQGLLNTYTEFERADGHTIWANMDQWEGQRWAFTPGNLTSTAQKVYIDPNSYQEIELKLENVIPPVEIPENTRWVKRIKFESEMLTEFWGHPIFIGATALLPRGYDENPNKEYPVIYLQNHFSLDPPFGFSTEPTENDGVAYDTLFVDNRSNVENPRPYHGGGVKETGYEFYQSWISEGFPEMIIVTFQHPTPYFDDSYGVNSVNNGPYGDAIIQELIPEIEEEFRIISEPGARALTGGSTGGWMSLALQVQNPKFFSGAWIYYPDPVDFRRYQLINIYEDENAFIVPNAAFGAPERMMQRTPEGQPVTSVRQLSQMAMALGSKGRSAAQFDIWNAAYGPIGEDGYPRRLWDFQTGEIDQEVANYMRENGYDLRHYMEENWDEIGPDLVGKIKIYNPEMDDFFLPLAVYLLEDFLENRSDPYYDGEIIHGRPMKGHGWSPVTNAELVKEIYSVIGD